LDEFDQNTKSINGNCVASVVDEESSDKGKLYKPTSRFEKEITAPSPVQQVEDSRPERLGKKKNEKEKKKSNLEIFKDELKL